MFNWSCLAQNNSISRAINCNFANNNASETGGAVHVQVSIVSQSNVIEVPLCNHTLKHSGTLTRVQWSVVQANVYALWDQMSSWGQYLFWYRFTSAVLPSKDHLWWFCDVIMAPLQAWECGRMQIFSYSWLHTQMYDSHTLRKELCCNSQNCNGIENGKEHHPWVSNLSHSLFGVNLSFQFVASEHVVQGLPHGCYDMWRLGKTILSLTVLPHVLSILGCCHVALSLKCAHSSQNCLCSLFFISHICSKYNFGRGTMLRIVIYEQNNAPRFCLCFVVLLGVCILVCNFCFQFRDSLPCHRFLLF